MEPRATLIIASFFLSVTAYASDKCEAIFAESKMPWYEKKVVMDISRTEKAITYVATPTNKSEIMDVISYAKSRGLKVTIKGTNHSHGGHNRRQEDAQSHPRAIQLDMLSYNKILNLDRKNMEVTVESGVTWKDLSVFLDKEGLAAMTEQSSNIFSIGGSVATNIHGRDIHGPISNSVKRIKFIDAEGVERVASRQQNTKIFRALLGGYGGLGVITEVTLKVEQNYFYEAHSVKDVSVASYVQYLKELSHKPTNLMHYGRVNISGKSPFGKMSYVEWRPVSDKSVPPTWEGWSLKLGEKNRTASSMVMNLMRAKTVSGLGVYVKDAMDKYFGLPKTGTLKTKNNIHNNPVQFLFDNFYNQKRSVDILQEYFIPVDKLESFLNSLKNTSERHDLALMNVTMRYVPKIEKNKDGLLSPYSDKTDLVAVVLYFNIKERGYQNNGDLVNYNGSQWTQELISETQNLGGSFYWPYHRWWSVEQLTHNQKDSLREYFKIKDNVDPQNIFESDFLYHLRKAQE